MRKIDDIYLPYISLLEFVYFFPHFWLGMNPKGLLHITCAFAKIRTLRELGGH